MFLLGKIESFSKNKSGKLNVAVSIRKKLPTGFIEMVWQSNF